MCRTLTGTVKTCGANVGSLKEIYIVRTESKDSISFDSSLDVSSIILDSGTFIRFPFVRNSASYDVAFSVDNTGSQEWNHSVTFKVNKRVLENHSAILSLVDGNKDLCVLVLDYQNQWRLLGWDYGMSISTISGGIGASKSEGSSYNITIAGIQDKPEYLVQTSAAESVLPA